MLPIYLNVYDVTKRDSVKLLNAVLAHWWAPVKLGGVFHVAVEINGIEWSYGKTFLISRPGVFGVPPGKDPNHSFREKLFLGYTKLSMVQHPHKHDRGVPRTRLRHAAAELLSLL